MCTNADKDALNELHESKEDGGQTIVLQFSPYMVRREARKATLKQLQERSQPYPTSPTTFPLPCQLPGNPPVFQPARAHYSAPRTHMLYHRKSSGAHRASSVTGPNLPPHHL